MRLAIFMGLLLLIGLSLGIGAADLGGDADTGLVIAVSRIPRTAAALLFASCACRCIGWLYSPV